MNELSEQLDRTGVAELLGVTPETVTVYRSRLYRDTFPEPDGKLGNSAWWWRSTIEKWNAARPGRTGRPRKS